MYSVKLAEEFARYDEAARRRARSGNGATGASRMDRSRSRMCRGSNVAYDGSDGAPSRRRQEAASTDHPPKPNFFVRVSLR